MSPNPDAPGQRKRMVPVAPQDPTPASGETVTLREDSDYIYADCKGFNRPSINCQITSRATGGNTSNEGTGVSKYGTDTDGDGNYTFRVAKSVLLPDLPREVNATAWDDDDTQHVAADPLTVS